MWVCIRKKKTLFCVCLFPSIFDREKKIRKYIGRDSSGVPEEKIPLRGHCIRDFKGKKYTVKSEECYALEDTGQTGINSSNCKVLAFTTDLVICLFGTSIDETPEKNIFLPTG